MSEARTILITGSTNGIGKAGALALGRQGWRVLVHARTAERGQSVLAALRQEVPSATFDLVTGDLEDLTQVEALAAQVHSLAPRLDVLWNNAGFMTTRAKTSAQGFESQWAVNHLAGFVLTEALVPLVERAPQGRLIWTSSFAHHIGKVPVDASFRLPAKYNGWTTYGDTKLANILLARSWARRLASTNVTTYAFHPGYVRTEFGSNGVPGSGNSGSWLRFVQVPVEKGAETGVFLATEAQGPSGAYWSSKRMRKGSAQITDAHAEALWDLTRQALKRG